MVKLEQDRQAPHEIQLLVVEHTRETEAVKIPDALILSDVRHLPAQSRIRTSRARLFEACKSLFVQPE